MIVQFSNRAAWVLAWPVLLALAIPELLADERRVPLTELGKADYQGETGGLYGEGRNEPAAAQRELAKKAIAGMVPRSTSGNPTADGKVVLLSLGMSNTTQEFSAFVQLANRTARKRPELLLMDGAQGGADALVWAGEPGPRRQAKADPWSNAAARLQAAGAAPAQVQAAWLKQAVAGPERYGAFPAHVKTLEAALVKIIRKAHQEYPNLRVVFLSSRIYGGYATGRLNPEPFAYESAFAVQRVIARQMTGDPELNCDSRRGKVRAPVLLWGPYLWADGQTPRNADGLVWLRDDFRDDGTHPSEQGRRKVAGKLLEFFTQDEFGKAVFLR